MLIQWGACPRHEWETSPNFSGTCPYGSVGAFEVTWPNSELARSFNTTHGWEFEPSTAFLAVCYAYSHVPYVLVFTCMFAFVMKRGTRELSVLIFLGFTCLTSELLVLHTKFLPADVQKRPEQSCVTTCGMPSTKSAVAVGCYILRFLDNLTRSRPSSLLSQGRVSVLTGDNGFSSGPVMKRIVRFLYEVGSVGVPLASWDEVVGDIHVGFLAFWMFLVLPVPLAVVQLRDNTMQQAFYGALSGFFLAIMWTLVARILQHRYNQYLGVTLLGFLRHNFALPCFMAERRCTSGNKKVLARRPSLAASWVGGSLAMSSRPERELQWYLDETNRRRELLRAIGFDDNKYLQDRSARLEELIKGVASKRGGDGDSSAPLSDYQRSEPPDTLQLPSSGMSITVSRAQETELTGSSTRLDGRSRISTMSASPRPSGYLDASLLEDLENSSPKLDGHLQLPTLPRTRVDTTRSDSSDGAIVLSYSGPDVTPSVVASRSVRL